MSQFLKLNNKLAVITGAASGIGLATARLFAKHEANLALVDIGANTHQIAEEIQNDALKLNKNIKVKSFVCDVTKSDQVSQVFSDLKSNFPEFSAANVIVNSAGIALRNKFTEITESDYDRISSINLKGTFLVSQAAIKELVSNYSKTQFQSETETYASIINLSSQAGSKGGPNAAHYCMTKAGVLGLTSSLSKEYGRYRIRVNSVLPYFIQTPMVQFNKKEEEFFKRATPFGRFGTADEVANVILFLASDASSYCSGSSIDVSGGF